MAVINSNTQTQKKSGLKTLKPREILFHENDHAESLFIIQKGQIRLFRPKGKGFVEIAILRAGEVIGEMAYFDEKARRRSCSAEAIVTTDVIEISFKAFGKTLEGLNPWFKTIIFTLAERLRKTNNVVKELESNSVSFGRDGKVAEYKFFTESDIVRGFAILYLVVKAHGDLKGTSMVIHMNRLQFYLFDVFNYSEIKYSELIEILRSLKMVEVENDKDGLPKILSVKNLEKLRELMRFFNTQRVTEAGKRITISPKCQRFLKSIMEQLISKGAKGNSVVVNLTEIINEFKKTNMGISEVDLEDALTYDLVGEIIVDEGNILTAEVNYLKLQELYPSILVMNEILKVNESKTKANARS